MNDRFKFRAWDNRKKVMHYFDGLLALFDMGNLVGLSTNFEGYMDDCRVTELKEGINKYNNDLEVMQCTGLKDKNDKLIYEGDILRYDFEYEGEKRFTISKVYWDNRLCGFELATWSKWSEDKQPFHSRLHNLTLQDKLNEEIIGNKFENPELLK